MQIVNVGYDSTNYYVLRPGGAGLLIDAGWPGTLAKFLAVLKRKDIPLGAIGHMLITHYHPDHAGLAEELKARGVRLIVMESQVAAIPLLQNYVKPTDGYVPITAAGNLPLTFAASRAFLRGLGIAGEIIATPGHSDDSVSLALDDGAVFTGDLTFPALAESIGGTLAESWAALRALGAATIYPGHGPVGTLGPPES